MNLSDVHSSNKPILVAITIGIAVVLLGGLATEIGPWYANLVKPSWQPPNWVFGPVWTSIYLLTGIAAVRAWRRGNALQRKRFLIALGINCGLNVLWSFLFFHQQRPDLAFVEVLLLWLSILALVLLPWSYSRRSSLLILPYLIWVSFAAYLNATIVQLNGSI
jgi:tryptophan-rich sensory protein